MNKLDKITDPMSPTMSHSEYMSKLHSGEGNPMYGMRMWDCPSAQGAHNQKAYSLMLEMFKFYENNKHKARGWGYKSFAKHIGWVGTPKTLITPMNWVQDNGDPRDNPEWIMFYAEYMEDNNEE